MKEVKNIIPIRVRKRDVVLNKWWRVVRDNGDGQMSFLLREAFLHYKRTKTFKDIGHIYVTKEDEMISESHSINIWIGGCEELKNWIAEMDDNTNLAQILREIARRSIQVVGSPDEEWIPGYLEMEENILFESVVKAPQEPIKPVKREEEKAESPKEPEVAEIKQPEKVEEVKKEGRQERPEETVKQERKVSRSSALLGSRKKYT